MSVTLNSTNFPDSNFRQIITHLFDKDSDGVLSNSELQSITDINTASFQTAATALEISNLTISTLKGIEYFSELLNLELQNMGIQTADLTKNLKLGAIILNGNRLESLPLSTTTPYLQLHTLWVEDNPLTALDISRAPVLTSLHISGARLSEINLYYNTSLVSLMNQAEIEEGTKTVDGTSVSYKSYVIEEEITTPDDETLIISNTVLTVDSLTLITGIDVEPEPEPDPEFIEITKEPSDVSVDVGGTATFSVTAIGSNLSYQWQIKNGPNTEWQDISGAAAKKKSYTISSVSAPQSGYRYRCRVYNNTDEAFTRTATLTITNYSPPKILHQPPSITVINGRTGTFYVGAEGGNLTYQWQKKVGSNWNNISGETGFQYIVTGAPALNQTQYRCHISNDDGDIYTNVATLTVVANSDDPVDLRNSGYHSIYISGKNTFFEWEMYPTSRPHVAPPEVKTSYVDLPGAHSGLDYTELLTGEPKFGYRKGSWEFLLIPQDRWAEVYRNLVDYFHGRQHSIILEDDPHYRYTGRLSVNEWQSAAHNSLITIDYILEPFAEIVSPDDEIDDGEDYIAAARILRKPANRDKVLVLQDSVAVVADPATLFEDGDLNYY